MIDRFVHNLVSFRRLYAASSVVILIVMAALSDTPVIDSSLAGYNIDNNPYDTVGKRMNSLFGSKNMIQVLVKPEATTVRTLFSGLDEVEDEISEAFPGTRAESLNSAAVLLYRKIKADSPVTEMLTASLNIPLIQDMVSRDTNSLMLVAFIDRIETFDPELFDSIIGKDYDGIESMSAVSQFHIQAAIEKSIIRDYIVLLPIILLFIVLFIYFAYRSIHAVIFCLINIGLSFIPVLFFLTIFDVSINQVTASALPVVVILSLSASVHLITGFVHRHEETDLQIRLYQTVRHYFIPCFLSSLTTAIAFGSFYLSDSHYIRQFGTVTAFSIIAVFILTFMIAPIALPFVPSREEKEFKFRLITRIEKLLIANNRLISLIIIGVMICSVFFISGIEFKTDLETYIPRNSTVFQSNKEINDAFHSLAEIDLLIELTDTAAVLHEKSLRQELRTVVSDIGEVISRYPEVASVQSVRNQLDFESHYMFFGLNPTIFPKKGNPYVSEDQRQYRINIKLRNQDDITAVIDRLEVDFQKYEPRFRHSIFSEFLYFEYISSSVTKSLLRSLLVSALLIFFLLFLLSLNLRDTLVSILANLIPLGFLIIIFAIFGIEMNITTSLTLVICLGLIVDDTIHILYRRINLAEPLEELGFGVLATSLILTGGFLSFVLSQSQPNQIFGLLCAIVFLIAVISDITVMTWLLRDNSMVSGRKNHKDEP